MAKLGFAFSFGARDDGMGRAMASAVDSLTKINRLMGVQNDLAKRSRVAGALKAAAGGAGAVAKGVGGAARGLAGAFGRGMQNRVNSFNLASMAQNIRSLTEDSGNLSNSMESIGASYAQQAKPALAMMGVTGKELKKLTGQASGMAYGLNVGVDTVVKTMGALRNAGGATKSVFKELGLSTTEFVKLAEGTGMATDQLGKLGGDLVASWGFTGKEAKQTLEYMVAMGQEGKYGAAMFTGMGDQMQGLNDILAKQVSTHMRSAAEIQNTVQASARLAGAYVQMGLTGEEAAKAAAETSNKFVDWQVQVERAQLGLGEMPDIFAKLSALGMGTEEAMRMISLGAQDSALGMREMGKYMQEAQASGKQLDASVLGDLVGTLGEAGSNVVYLAMSTDRGAKALDTMNAASVKADGALKRLANDSYSSGRTLQEGLDMAKEAFMTRVRSITRPEVRGYVKEEIQNYKELGKQAKELAKDATWGPLIKAYSIFDQMGAKGVLLHFGKQLGMDTKQAQKFGVVTEMAMDAVGKVQQSIAPVMETLGMGPLTGVVGGVAGWFMLPQDARDKLVAQFTPLWERVKTQFGPVWDRIVVAAKGAWKDFSAWFGKTVWPEIEAVIGKGWTVLMTEGGLVDQGIAKVKAYFGKMWDNAGFGGKAMMVGVVGVLAGQIPGVGMLISKVVGGALSAAFNGLGAAASASPGLLGLAGIITGIGIVAINAWFDYLNKGLDEQIAKSTAKIDAQYARVKGLQEANRIDQANLNEDFGALGTTGDVRKMDASLRSALTTQTNYAAQARKQKTGYYNVGIGAPRLEEMAGTFERVQGLPGFQLQAAEVGQAAAAKFGPGESYNKAKYTFDQLDLLAKTWAVKSQAQIDQMTAQAANLQTRLGEVYGMTFVAPSAETLARLSAAGVELIAQVGAGVQKAAPELEQSTKAVFDEGFIPLVVGNSPPPKGPLANRVLPDAGYNLIMQIGDGIREAQGDFELGFATVLEESAAFAINAFQAKALEEFKNSSINQEVFGKITAQYGGILTEDDKKVLKSSLDMSGLYGVINAVILDGVETRRVLTDIATNTAGLRGWTPGGGGSGWGVYQPSGAAGQPPAAR